MHQSELQRTLSGEFPLAFCGGPSLLHAITISIFRLHINFHTCGQQSVTGVENADDANSYWQIRGKPNRPCQRGASIKCGQVRQWHTHSLFEVSAFGENGEGDDLDVWTVQCDGVHWERDETVRFKHVGTDVFLSVTGEQYGHPIRGQREVHGMSSSSPHNWWRAMEGVFIQPSQELLRHDEL
uniref:Stromal cell-derived factor 2-like 1 n=1 Tax=Seriola lalandi dorsalis TaxID=1841481 RepID=A0A3B4WS80_SERLL